MCYLSHSAANERARVCAATLMTLGTCALLQRRQRARASGARSCLARALRHGEIRARFSEQSHFWAAKVSTTALLSGRRLKIESAFIHSTNSTRRPARNEHHLHPPVGNSSCLPPALLVPCRLLLAILFFLFRFCLFCFLLFAFCFLLFAFCLLLFQFWLVGLRCACSALARAVHSVPPFHDDSCSGLEVVVILLSSPGSNRHFGSACLVGWLRSPCRAVKQLAQRHQCE